MKLDDIFILPPGFSIEKMGRYFSPMYNGKYISYSGFSYAREWWLRESAVECCWHHFKHDNMDL
jgi:hypothetical protein